MAVPVKLKDIVDELSFIPDEASSYLNTKTGEVISITHEELRAAENEEPLEDFPEWQHDVIRLAGETLQTDDYLWLLTGFCGDSSNRLI
jgi:hypothetical protein